MTDVKNSTPSRYNVDIGVHQDALEQAAIEDSATEGRLYNVPEYVRETLAAFLHIRATQREQGLPITTPMDTAKAFLSTQLVETLP